MRKFKKKNNISNPLSKALKEKGYSISGFCKETGLSRSLVTNYLNGTRFAKKETIKRIADVLEYPESYFYEYDDIRTRFDEKVDDFSIDSYSMETNDDLDIVYKDVASMIEIAFEKSNLDTKKQIVDTLYKSTKDILEYYKKGEK